MLLVMIFDDTIAFQDVTAKKYLKKSAGENSCSSTKMDWPDS